MSDLDPIISDFLLDYKLWKKKHPIKAKWMDIKLKIEHWYHKT